MFPHSITRILVLVHSIILYDGFCGLCNRFVRFTLRRDPDADFRFAALQSPFAAGILKRHHLDRDSENSVCVVVSPGAPDERLLSRSDAAIYVLSQLAAPWRFAGFLLRLLPKFLRDAAYKIVARQRYLFFGRYRTCPLPPAEFRNRFLDS